MNFQPAQSTCDIFDVKKTQALINTCLQNESHDDIICFLHYLEDADGAVQPSRSHDIAVNLQVPDGVGVQRDVVQDLPGVPSKDFRRAVVAACRNFTYKYNCNDAWSGKFWGKGARI